MSKVLNSFWDENRDAFERSFERHNEKVLSKRTEYANLIKERNTIYENYPKIKDFIENGKISKFEADEIEILKKLINIFNEIKKLELLEAFKLGAKDAYTFFDSMNMFNIL